MSTIELELTSQQLNQLTGVARLRQVPVARLAQTAVTEWLEQQQKMEQARAAMREFGRGLGAGCNVLHDAADRHDSYLYTRGEGE